MDEWMDGAVSCLLGLEVGARAPPHLRPYLPPGTEKNADIFFLHAMSLEKNKTKQQKNGTLPGNAGICVRPNLPSGTALPL